MALKDLLDQVGLGTVTLTGAGTLTGAVTRSGGGSAPRLPTASPYDKERLKALLPGVTTLRFDANAEGKADRLTVVMDNGDQVRVPLNGELPTTEEALATLVHRTMAAMSGEPPAEINRAALDEVQHLLEGFEK